MDIRVLGPLEAFADGTDVTPTSPNQRTVLAWSWQPIQTGMSARTR
jgi:hypothetical protein